ncbi:MAG: Trk system potassium transporter TrkA [Butyrivibrio sp.]|uniref:Trk system potassium transporter TrkA n=1 Tax=Butyrivibrio sp. TaxID=28121 RepID=UPI001B4FE69B|nr:Trk system potassium transporter TrkA [Butyrivibrio sp.]MBP3279830.1 Trk system potassium transporter TrkA [Butyrivibrio sp.]MBP3782544.1 Trk system potassium transporter TrkA [Butyrivibrio sp.]
MRIIVVGCGNVGLTLTEQLSKEGHNITVIEEQSSVVQTAVNSLDVLGIVGNGASYSIMKDAGIDKADLMIAVTDSDELNLLCCLIAKKAGNCHTIARVRNPIYKKEINFIKEELGLSMVINPEEAAATEAGRLLKLPSATKIETFARGRAELVRLVIDENSRLKDLALKDIPSDLKKHVVIAVVTRGNDVFIPDGSFILRAGDEITIIGSSKNTVNFFKKLGLPSAKVHSTIIIGGGETGYYLAMQLIALGIKVTIFDKDPVRCKELTELLPQALVINGDGTDKDMLLEEGVMSTESFVSLTNLDEENIMLSMYVKSINPKAKLITKVHRVNYGEIIGSLGIGSIIYPKNITADRIVQFVRGMSVSKENNIETLYKLNDDRVEALEFIVKYGSPIIGVPLAKLKLKKGILIACINHYGEIISPTGESVIRDRDSVIVVTTQTGLNDINDILEM